MLKQISNVVSAISKNKIKFIILYLIVCTIIYVVVKPTYYILSIKNMFYTPYIAWIFKCLTYLFCVAIIVSVFFTQFRPLWMWVLASFVSFLGYIFAHVYNI